MAKLSEARYNHDSWSHKYKPSDNKDNAASSMLPSILKSPSPVERLVNATFGFLYAICGVSGLLIVLVPGPVLVLLYMTLFTTRNSSCWSAMCGLSPLAAAR